MKSRRTLITGRKLASPPSRGAWIEIDLFRVLSSWDAVAPLAGGVD